MVQNTHTNQQCVAAFPMVAVLTIVLENTLRPCQILPHFASSRAHFCIHGKSRVVSLFWVTLLSQTPLVDFPDQCSAAGSRSLNLPRLAAAAAFAVVANTAVSAAAANSCCTICNSCLTVAAIVVWLRLHVRRLFQSLAPPQPHKTCAQV